MRVRLGSQPCPTCGNGECWRVWPNAPDDMASERKLTVAEWQGYRYRCYAHLRDVLTRDEYREFQSTVKELGGLRNDA